MQEPITIVRNLPGEQGHVTVRAQSVEEALALYGELVSQAGALLAPVEPVQAQQAAVAPAPEQPAEPESRLVKRSRGGVTTLVDPQQVCPEHGKAAHGHWGAYCPTRVGENEEGEPLFCKWRPRQAKKGAA